MKPVEWLSVREATKLHARVLECARGAGGIRDYGLLGSAIARPRNQYSFGERDVFKLAAYYAESLVRNHPFVDGNKRTAFTCAAYFLLKNGFSLGRQSGTSHEDIIVDLARGNVDINSLAKHLKQNSINL